MRGRSSVPRATVAWLLVLFVLPASAEHGDCADAPPLELEITPDREPVAVGIHDGAVTITATAVGGCGDSTLMWRSGLTHWQPYPGPLGFQGTGTHELEFVATDDHGVAVEEAFTLKIDADAPTLDIVIQDGHSLEEWLREPPNLLVSANDIGPAGIDLVRYRIGSGDWHNVTGPIKVESSGRNLVTVEAIDAVNNSAQTLVVVLLDQAPPTLEVTVQGATPDTWSDGPASIHVQATDSPSGVDRVEWRFLGAPWQPVTSDIRFEEGGTHGIQVRAVDLAGNQDLKSLTLRIDVEPPTLPDVSWLDLGEGQIYADWEESPPFDPHSGVSSIAIERAGSADDQISVLADLDAVADGAMLDLDPGYHLLRARVTDVAGNSAVSTWVEVWLDSDPFALDEGLDRIARTVSGTIAVVPDGDPSSIEEVRFYIDGRLRAVAARAPFEYRLDTQSLSDGPHTVTMVVLDKEGIVLAQTERLEVQNQYGSLVRTQLPVLGLATLSLLAAAYAAFRVRRRWVEVFP